MNSMLILFALQDDVVAARPDIDARVEQMVSKGRWIPVGYKVCTFFLLVFVPLRIFFLCAMNGQANKCRKNSEIFRFFKRERDRNVHLVVSQILYFSHFTFVFPISRLYIKAKSTGTVIIAINVRSVLHTH